MSIYYQDEHVEIKVYSDKEIQEIKNRSKQDSKAKKDAKRRIYAKKRRQKDTLFRLSNNLRSLIRITMVNGGFKKNTKTYNILGCTFEEFKSHIESQFLEGMSWDNYGQWEYDHKVPVSWGKTESEIIELNHHSNIQPMWREDNQRKSNKFIG